MVPGRVRMYLLRACLLHACIAAAHGSGPTPYIGAHRRSPVHARTCPVHGLAQTSTTCPCVHAGMPPSQGEPCIKRCWAWRQPCTHGGVWRRPHACTGARVPHRPARTPACSHAMHLGRGQVGMQACLHHAWAAAAHGSGSHTPTGLRAGTYQHVHGRVLQSNVDIRTYICVCAYACMRACSNVGQHVLFCSFQPLYVVEAPRGLHGPKARRSGALPVVQRPPLVLVVVRRAAPGQRARA